MSGAVRVGIDFDNTLVCYDEVMASLARELALPADRAWNKGTLRDFLRAQGREDDWTELQGRAYGPDLKLARAFPGAVEFLRRCVGAGIFVAIVSHKTETPLRGPRHDLHGAAREWLEANGFFDPRVAGLKRSDVYLEPTKDGKLRRIAELHCTHFVDDLPEFLLEPGFPPGVARLLFDPEGACGEPKGLTAVRSWPEVARCVLR